jgi:hypothetical protein
MLRSLVLTLIGSSALACSAGSQTRSARRPPTPAPRASTDTAHTRVAVAIVSAAPAPLPAPPIEGAGGDTARVDDVVRRRAMDLQTCYQEEGLKRNPDLAGELVIALTVDAAGAVKSATVSERTWSGEGAGDAESCITKRLTTWTIPGVVAGGTFEFPFRFSR